MPTWEAALSRILPALAMLSAVLTVIPAAQIGAQTTDCPQSCVSDICTTLPVNSLSRTSTCELPVPGQSTSNSSYNLPAGLVGASFSVGGDCSGGASATARDRFVLVGPSSPNPVTFNARLGVRLTALGSSCCLSAQTIGRLQEASGPPVQASANSFNAPFVETVLILPIAHSVGEPFELTYSVSTGGSGPSASGSGGGALSFVGLPPGYGVESCQGFSGVVVATRPRTWGEVKASYR